jgi:predicted GNAT family N-acyltransferase
MTAHPLELARSMSTKAHQRDAKHTLSELDIGRFGRRTVIFTPTAAAADRLLALARKEIRGLADARVIYRVLSHNPDVLWAIARRAVYDARIPEAEGFVAFLMLNKAGLKELAEGTLDRSNPDLSLLAGQNERPAGIYTWALFAPPRLVGAIPLIYEKLRTPLYDGVSLYAWAATPDGKRFAETLGFTLGAPVKGAFASYLHYFERGRVDAGAPLYDSYRAGSGSDRPTVTVARTFDDLMRVVAIRSAVYMAEQDCPYEEEFDGNDLSATHLIGYIGDEPAGCIRIRYFAGFVKVERLAVRHEFRKSKLAFRLVRAAVELCRKKGYRRIYGHARKDLLRFWQMFGARPMPDRAEFNFSDLTFVEFLCEVAPDAEALRIGDEPYLLIRPEGRWTKPGILERSATRGARPIAKEKRA